LRSPLDFYFSTVFTLSQFTHPRFDVIMLFKADECIKAKSYRNFFKIAKSSAASKKIMKISQKYMQTESPPTAFVFLFDTFLRM
jgi:hypothetical protein